MKDCGIILVDKPAAITSFDVIRRLRHLTGMRKMGHTGTLDPFATGLLPVCLGKATRIADRLLGAKKEYLTVLKFGVATNSGDITGKTESTRPIPHWNHALADYITHEVMALQELNPHPYSAIKLDGVRAYKKARQQEEFTIPSRPVKIFDFQILSYEAPYLTYRVIVSKGTYIRSLSEKIGKLAGSIATCTELRRLRTGALSVDKAVALDQISSENWQNYLRDVAEILTDTPKMVVENKNIASFGSGRTITTGHDDEKDIMLVNEAGDCIGFGEISAHQLQPRVVLI
ncbi:MAG: tRNA pseudouridine(55) synthase TruB [Candidatus Cloacimonetes bacterium]|nr:tRNA pseudouridine(55) synthase TruB [Candidatus Cloacimonadota bacterium]